MSDSVGSVSVDVVPDARGWSEKLRAQIRDQRVKIKADADTTEAEAQLDETARTRTATIRADTSQLSRGASSLDGFIGKLGLLPALAIAAGAALIPLGAAIGGVVAALAAPLAIAGGGATLFALLGGAAIKQTQGQLKNIDTLQKKLDGLTKGTQEYADTQKQLRDAQAALSPAQERFAASLGSLKGAFSDLLGGKTGQSLLGPFTQGMDLLTKILPLVAPLLTSVSDAFSTLLGDLSRATGGSGFKHFVDQFARLAGRDIVIGGRILGDLARGVGGLLTATDKGFSGGFLHGIHQLTSSFADWANSKDGRRDVNKFFDYVHTVGPQVADTIGAIARGAGHFVKALAPLGPPVLHIIEGIADAFNSIPVPVLTALAGATAGLVAFQKVGGLKATSFLTKGLGGGGVADGLLSGGVQKVFVVNMGAGGLGGGPGGGLTKGLTGTDILKGAGLGGLLLAGGDYYTSKTHQNPLTSLPGILGLPVAEERYTRGLLSGQKHLPSLPSALGGYDPNGLVGSAIAKAQASPSLKSTTNAFDGLRARAQAASRQIDMIGPHADNVFAAASHDVDAFTSKLNSIHDKKFAIIAQTQSAISSLERLQAMRIADKSFTVYQRSQLIDQAVGPGGGRGRSNPGGGSGGGAGRTPVHIHLDNNGRTTLDGYVQGHAQDVYDANQRYQGAHG